MQWSPVHPSLFAAVDGDGYIDVWDINKDVEAPIARKKVYEASANQIAGQRDFDESSALSCLKWSHDGRRIAIGDQNGFVSIWQADKELYMPNASDFDCMDKLLKENSPQEQD